MNSLKDFIVFVPQRLNDKIVVNGLELYVDPKYDEFSHRKTSGEVVAVPLKYNTGVKEGDTIYNTIFHIDRAYYNFWESTFNAVSSNGNPFGQPSAVISNLEGNAGAIGIFTGLSYDRVMTIVKK